MKEISQPETELTRLEYERYKKCVSDFGNAGHVYFVPEMCLGAGYAVVYSAKPAETPQSFDENCSRNITDMNRMLDVS
jgi:hypothetical protein